MKSDHPNWVDLPIELWASISRKHVTSIHDYLSFRGVCRSWRSIYTFDNFDAAISRVPWLMYVSSGITEEEPGKYIYKKYTNLLDLSTNKVHKMLSLHPTDRKGYLSCGGWILCVSDGNGEVCLTHPMRPVRIQLPGLNTFPPDDRGRFIGKMVLSGSPMKNIDDDFVVMVIWGQCSKRLGFSRPGDKSWTAIDGGSSFSDILYHNGKLYAMNSNRAAVLECDIHGSNPTQLRQVFSLPYSGAYRPAVAASDDDLFIMIILI
ncbi:putative F-box protein at5g55150 [Phtheirospermum japonicum]|uniref:Putative F-box protein at5g55150 n=1 Tax=Phtheirospermum japonicum TaxID=374723 RepID=A0A830C9G1_9LAMI|nr:putative F-box protein at5g55150 [Phtheirospermum japonicum]